MRPRTKTLSLITVTALAILVLSSAFSGIATNPLLSEPLNAGDRDNVPEISPSVLDVSDLNNSKEVLFRVLSANGLKYLRTGVYATYAEGTWEELEEAPRTYVGGSDINVGERPSVSFSPHYVYIEPVLAMTSSLPIAKDTSKASLEEDVGLTYDEETQTMNLQGELTSRYRVDFYLPSYDEEALRVAGVTPEDRYLEVPAALSERLKGLADLITGDRDPSYENALAIAEFLKNNYQYNLSVSAPPGGTDPLERFLFGNKEGVCTHFNTAFVLLARSLNIPARLCSGYLIDPHASVQEVFPGMAHAYAEIRLDGVGWVLFDATPGAGEIAGGGNGGSGERSPDADDPDTSGPGGGNGGSDEAPPDADGPGISGHVYVDSNENGTMDDGELTLPNCTVVLRDQSKKIITAGRTNGSGAYSFTSPGPGNYWVEAFPPEGWKAILPNPENIKVVDRPEVIDFGVISDDGSDEIVDTFTDITHWEEVVGKRSAFFVNGTVNAEGGGGVSGLQVLIYLAENKTSDKRILIGEATVHDGLYSASCTVPDDMGLGKFQLIARTVGGNVEGVEYASSESDPTVNVTDASDLSLEGPSKVLAGRGTTFSVTLREYASGQPVPGAPVEVWVGDRNETYTTGPDGAFNFTVDRDTAGTVRVRAVYQGTESLGPADGSIDVEVLSPTAEVLVTDLVRGENNTIAGRAYPGDLIVRGEKIVIRLANGMEANGTTDAKGLFTIVLTVPLWSDLGSTSATIEVAGTKGEPFGVNITARTNLSARLDGNIAVVRLTDDVGNPMRHAKINIQHGDSSEEVLTDLNGTVHYSVGTGEQASRLDLTYLGSPLYQLSKSSLEVPPLPSSPWPWELLLPLLIAPTAAVGAMIYRRRSASPPPAGPPAPPRPSVVPAPLPSPYVLSFPQIAASLPDVWGEGDPFWVEVRGPEGSATVNIDGKDARALELGQGAAGFSLDLPLGEHAIGIRGGPGRGERRIRIVRYRDETIRRYREARASWKAAWPDLRDDLTPREVDYALEGRVGPESSEGLAEATALFERADYSTHPVTRKEFEDMHHALGKVRG